MSGCLYATFGLQFCAGMNPAGGANDNPVVVSDSSGSVDGVIPFNGLIGPGRWPRLDT